VDWKDDPSYLNWHAGPVFDDVQQLDSSLKLAVSTHDQYHKVQVDLFKSTFNITEQPSSVRAANEILEYMKKS
jgi:hypothetical protein